MGFFHDTFTARPALPEEVKRLGWVSFFTDVASEMIYPVVPLFLTSVLGAPVAILGTIEGLAEVIVSLMKGLSGWHCDKLGRRVPYIRWGYGLGAMSKPLMAMAFSWPTILLARAVDRTGKGLRTTARDALIADAVDASQGGQAFGFHRMMDTAGAMLGVLLATILLALLPGHYRIVFLVATLPGLAAVWLTFRLKEAAQAPACAQSSTRDLFTGQAWVSLPKAFWMTLAPLLVFAFANSSDTFLILRAKNLGLSDTQSIMAYLLFNLVYALSAYPLGILSDRVGRWRMILCGWALYGFVYLGVAWADMSDVWWLFAVYGLFMGLTDGVDRALIRDQIPEDRKGTAMGIFHMGVGFMALAGSIAAGLCWDLIGPGAPFVLDGVAAFLAVLVAVTLRKHITGEAEN
ncbi:MAG: MFS transporter [Deltaproteobacteria bacterium]|nr:MFS transporter [Deltaproteobacteria bacterium]